MRRRAAMRRWVAGSLALAVALGGAGAALVVVAGNGGGPEPIASVEPPETVACGGSVPEEASELKPIFRAAPEMAIDPDRDYTATMRTSCGTIVFGLFAAEAPATVNSFVFLAEEGFFDGLTFHRVVPRFVIQGGDPDGDGRGGPGYRFEDEIVPSLRYDRPGLLGMANSGPDTNGSQFFVTVAKAPSLDGAYTLFGEVARGMGVVKRINKLSTDPNERPLLDVYIEKVTIEVS